MAALIGPDLVVLRTAPLGALSMLGAAIRWAIGTVLFKRFDWSFPVGVPIAGRLLVGAIVISPGALLLEPVPDLTELSGSAMIVFVYLFAMPMVSCQWSYFKVVRIFATVIAAIGILAVPAFGVYQSALILGEPVGLMELVALMLISAALAVVLAIPAIGGYAARTSK